MISPSVSLSSSIHNISISCSFPESKQFPSKISPSKLFSRYEPSSKIPAALALPENLQPEPMPKHLAVIMDGHRRWAAEKGLKTEDGHRAGGRKMGEIARLCNELGVKVLTVFAFSTENWVRAPEEINFLMSLFEEEFTRLLETSKGHGMRISVIGDTSKLPESLKGAIATLERATMANKGLHLLAALNYGGRQDIIRATKRIADKVKDGKMLPEEIDGKLFEEELQTNCADFPNLDLLIRTSGEKRISNFLLWQSAYTELYFVDKFFPDFGEDDFMEAILAFQRRQRRFGGRV